MKLKHLPLLAFLLVIISIAVIPGVFATWKYSTYGPQEKEMTLALTMSEFKWDGSENLPDAVEGENHAWLISNMVYGEGVGLNDPDSVLNDRIKDRVNKSYAPDYFGSMAVTGGDEIQEIFDTKTEGLSFIVHAESDTVYYIYTTSVDLGQRGSGNTFGNKEPGKPNIPIEEWIYPVYQTKLVRANKNADFEVIETKRGRAKSAWYKETQIVANTRSQIPAFDIENGNWQEIEMGKDTSNNQAIWTFIGDNPTAYATKSMQHLHYRIKPSTSKTCTVWTSNENSKITILASNGTTELATSGDIVLQPDGTYRVAVSWSAVANNTYYIKITGDDVMQFHVE